MGPVGAVRLALGEGRWEVDGEEAESPERRHMCTGRDSDQLPTIYLQRLRIVERDPPKF